MGMDVYGKNPSDPVGEYFRRNVWGWRPLANFVLDIAPEALTRKCEHWHSNDGDGLDGADSITLAAILEESVTSGRAQAYLDARAAKLAKLPRETCAICGGTGCRTDEIGVKGGWPERIAGESNKDPANPRAGQKGSCNGCDGWGTTANWETHYGMEVSCVSEFAAFLKTCGGFEIC